LFWWYNANRERRIIKRKFRKEVSMGKKVSIKRLTGTVDLPTRAQVFGPDANADLLICGECEHGAKEEEWLPTMKRSQCPVCGNRENHTTRKKKK
jgi:rubrerythrin